MVFQWERLLEIQHTQAQMMSEIHGSIMIKGKTNE